MARVRLLRKDVHDRLSLHVLHQTDLRQEFGAAVVAGLSASPKSIPPKYFYDGPGSDLFERITETEEYYLTRTETAILAQRAPEIADEAGNPATVVEFGSGSSTKTRLLLDALSRRHERLTYQPIDISASVVQAFAPRLLADYPTLSIEGLVTDYRHALEELRKDPAPARLFLFLGSSLGNFDPAEAQGFLADVAGCMRAEDRFLLGVDLVKPQPVLDAAYNDRKGVNAAFNLNLLARINRELGGHFDLSRFRHIAFFNGKASRIEMHLESLAEQTVSVDALGRSFQFAREERIHTENSYKYDAATLDGFFRTSGLARLARWTDPNEWFALNLLGKK